MVPVRAGMMRRNRVGVGRPLQHSMRGDCRPARYIPARYIPARYIPARYIPARYIPARYIK
jgi:hypothetical protein